MTDQATVIDNVIHFSCQHCQISLTVDASLAGVTGPCPSCGASMTAPAASVPSAVVVKPRDVKKREAQTDEVPEVARPKVEVQIEPSERPRRRRGGGRAISPNTGLSETYQEKVEVAAVVKMLIAGLVVVGIVLVVAFWLKSEMA